MGSYTYQGFYFKLWTWAAGAGVTDMDQIVPRYLSAFACVHTHTHMHNSGYQMQLYVTFWGNFDSFGFSIFDVVWSNVSSGIAYFIYIYVQWVMERKRQEQTDWQPAIESKHGWMDMLGLYSSIMMNDYTDWLINWFAEWRSFSTHSFLHRAATANHLWVWIQLAQGTHAARTTTTTYTCMYAHTHRHACTRM